MRIDRNHKASGRDGKVNRNRKQYGLPGRLSALLLAVIMLLGSVNVPVYAEEGGGIFGFSAGDENTQSTSQDTEKGEEELSGNAAELVYKSVHAEIRRTVSAPTVFPKKATKGLLAPGSAARLASVPDDDDIVLTGRLPKDAVVEATPVDITIEGQPALAAYDIKIYADPQQQAEGITWQPVGEQIGVEIRSAALQGANDVQIYHVDDVLNIPSIIGTTQAANGEVSFTADSFSVYAVVKTVLEKTISTPDGLDYKITVTYDSESGLPVEEDGAMLKVREASEEEYIDQTKSVLGVDSLAYTRAFDISIVDQNGKEYQPDKEVSVSIRLIGETGLNNPKVVHIPDTDSPSMLPSSYENDTVTFTTDGFSIMVVADEDEEEQPNYVYLFVDGITGYVYYRQQVFEGGTVSTPADPNVEGKIFHGWFNSFTKGGTGEEDVWGDPFEPVTVTGIPEDSKGENAKVFTVYGRFEDKAYISFYAQDGTTVERLLSCDIGELVKMGVKDVTYTPIPSGTTYYKFLGWTESAEYSDRYPDSEASAAPAGNFYATANRSFYPILLSGHWIYFNTNSTGSGVKYIEPEFIHGATAPVAPEKPVRAGWQFDGWYDAATGGTQVFDADGNKMVNTYDNGIEENLTLYAHWTGLDTKITAVWWIQNSTDAAGIPEDQKTYDFIKQETWGWDGCDHQQHIISGNNYRTDGDGWANPARHITSDDPNGFVYNETLSNHTTGLVEGDGSTTINIYFDRKTFTLSFRDYLSSNSDKSQSAIQTGTEMAHITALYGSDISGNFPLSRIRNEGIAENAISAAWSWYAPNQSPSTLANFFKVIQVMPVLGNGTNGTTLYFAHNQATAQGYSHTYVEIDPDEDVASLDLNADVDGMPGIKKYINMNGTIYQHYLTQAHGYTSGQDSGGRTGGSDPTSSTKITRKNYFFDIAGFAQEQSSPAYYVFTGTNNSNGVKNINNYKLSNADDAVPYARTTDDNKWLGQQYNSDGTQFLRYHKDIKSMFHYYNRSSKTLAIRVKLEGENPTAPLNGDKVNGELLKFQKDISESYLQSYLDAYLETNPIPDGMEFTGWYTDVNLQNKITDFSKLSMPADNLTLYAGIKYKWYLVNIDGNGGEVDQSKNQTTWLWRQYGDKSLSEYNIHRDYVQREGGEYSYVVYGRGYADDTVRKAEYVKTSELDPALRSAAGVTVTDGYVYEKNAYILIGWYELDHVETDGTKVLKDTPYPFGTEIDHSMTLVAKWRRNATYHVIYDTNAADEGGNSYTITPPVDEGNYAEGSGAVLKSLKNAPEGKRLKYWRLPDGTTVKANESMIIRDDVAVTVKETDTERIREIKLTAVLEEDPGSGDIGGSTTDVRHYWFFIGQEPEQEVTDLDAYESDTRVYYNTLQAKDMTKKDDKEFLGKAAYYVQNISPGEELVVPTPPDDPSGKGRPFRGWYTDPDLTMLFSGFGTIGSPQNTRLYAKFDPGWLVTYQDKDGNIIGKQTYAKSGKAHLVTYGVTYTPTDGTMMYGWSQTENATEPEYTYNDINAQTLIINENITLYPVTGMKQYLYFDVNGGSNYVDPVLLPIDRRPEAPAQEASRPGYIFQGWFTEKEGGEQYRFRRDDQLPIGVTKLYAHWELAASSTVDSSYKVIWWVPQENGTYAFSNEITESNAVFVANRIDSKPYADLMADGRYATVITEGRAYYVLDHAVDNNGKTLYAVNEEGTVTTDLPLIVEDHGSEINIYLSKIKNAALTFNANDGKFADNSAEYSISGIALGDDLTSSWPESPTREGYYFTGWNTAQNGSGTSCSAGKATATMLDAGTLYAQWTTMEQPASTDTAQLTYKVEAKYLLEDGDTTKEIIEYTDINYDQYNALKANDYAEANFGAWKKNFDGYTYNSFTKNGDTTGQNGSKVTDFAYHYSWRYSGTLYWVQKRVLKEANFVDRGTQYDSWTLENGNDRLLRTITLYKGYSGSGITISPYEGKNPVYPDAYMEGIHKLSIPEEENPTLSNSELTQENTYISQVAEPLVKTNYHPGVISITMRYSKNEPVPPTPTYNLTFKDLEGGNTTVSQAHEEGDAISAITLSSAPEYKTFKHWSETENGEEYTFGTMPAEDVTLYAVWQSETVKVTTRNTFVVDLTYSKPVCEGKDFTGDKGAAFGTFEIPDPPARLDGLKQYVFDHWATSLSGGKTLSFSDVITENTTIHAIWKELPAPKYVHVYYDLNGGTLGEGGLEGASLVEDGASDHNGQYKDETEYLVGGSAMALAANLKKTDPENGREYKLVCWTTNPDGTGMKFYPGESIPLAAQDVTVYASYSYYRETTLSYDLNTEDTNAKFYEAAVTGEGSDKVYTRTNTELDRTLHSTEILFKDYLDLTEDDNAREPNTPYEVGTTADDYNFTAFRYGYRFKGWSDDKNADPSGTYIQPGTKIQVDTKDEANNILYAIWEEVKLPVKVFKVTRGDYSHAEEYLIQSGQRPYLGVAETSEEDWIKTGDEAVEIYNAAVRNGVPSTDVFGKLTLTGSDTIVTNVRYLKEENAWSYSTDNGETWSNFDDGGLTLYYYPKTIYPTDEGTHVYWVIWDETGTLTKISAGSYDLKAEDMVSRLPDGIGNETPWSSTALTGAKDEITSLTDPNIKQPLVGFAIGSADFNSDSSSLNAVNPLMLKNTVDGTLHGSTAEGLATSEPYVGEFAVYVMYGVRQDTTLKVSKKVTGGMGDLTEPFTFTLNVEGAQSGDTFSAVKAKTGSSGTDTTVTQGGTFTLTHGESITIRLPVNKTVTLTEDHGYYAMSVPDSVPENMTDYEKTYDSGSITSVNGVSFKLDDAAEIEIENHLDNIAPTGVVLRFLPWMIMALAGGAILLTFRRRKQLD